MFETVTLEELTAASETEVYDDVDSADPNEMIISEESCPAEPETEMLDLLEEETEDPNREPTVKEAIDELETDYFENFRINRRAHCKDPSDFMVIEVTMKKPLQGLAIKGGIALMDNERSYSGLVVKNAPGMSPPRMLEDYSGMTLLKMDAEGKFSKENTIDDDELVPEGTTVALIPTEIMRRTITWISRPSPTLAETDIALSIRKSIQSAYHDYWQPKLTDKVLWQDMHFMTTGGGLNAGQMNVHLKGIRLPHTMPEFNAEVAKDIADDLLSDFFNTVDLAGKPEIEWKVSNVDDFVFHLDGKFIKMDGPGLINSTQIFFRDVKKWAQSITICD